MNRKEYFCEPRYMSKVDNGDYYSYSDDDISNTLMELCVKNLTGKQKTYMSLLDSQYPKIHECIINEIEEKKENVLDSIAQLYYDQLHYRYPELVNQKSGVVKMPLLKCCLMNQSIRVVATHDPLVLDILPL